MFGPQKGNIFIIFDGFIKTFFVLLGLIIATMMVGPEKLLQNGYVIVIAIFLPTMKLIEYAITTYEVKEDMLIVRKEFINKKKIEIPLESITTVDLTQNLIFQWKKVQKIRIENTVQIAGNTPNIKLALKNDEAYVFKNLLLSKKRGLNPEDCLEGTEVAYKEKYDTEINVDTGAFFLLGLLKSKVVQFTIIIGGAGSAIGFIIDMGIRTESIQAEVLKQISNFGIIVSIILAVIACYILSLITSVAFSLIKYLNFSIKKDKHAIYVNYGFLDKKSFSLTKEKITGIAMKQSFLMRIFKYYTLEIFAIGYGGNGNDNKEIAILYPIGKKEKIEEILRTLLPELELETEFKREKKKTLRYFFYAFHMFVSTILFLGAIITNAMIRGEIASQTYIYFDIATVITGILFLISVIHCIFEYYNVALGIGENTIGYITGGFQRTITILKKDFVETVTWSTSIWKRKKFLGHLIIKSFGPLVASKARVKNFRLNDFEKLKGKINY